MITQKRLKELFHYDPNTGYITRTSSVSNVKRGDIAGGKTEQGYIRIRVDGKKYLGHRLAWLYVYGRWPRDQIDHINHDRADNRLENLREVSSQTNCRNQSVRPDNNSGFTGISWDKDAGKWKSQIVALGKKINLGRYSDISDAVKVRSDAECRFGYHKNHGLNDVS